MEAENLKGKLCAIATPRPDGSLFWIDGVFEGENPTHYFFRVKGHTHAMLRTSILRIEEKAQAPFTPAARTTRGC